MSLTVDKLVQNLSEDVREEMHEFLYSRTPYMFIFRENTISSDTRLPLP